MKFGWPLLRMKLSTKAFIIATIVLVLFLDTARAMERSSVVDANSASCIERATLQAGVASLDSPTGWMRA